MTVLAGVVPVFAIIALGALARRLGWVDDRFAAQVNLVVYFLALPALLLRLLGRTQVDAGRFGPLLAVCCAACLVTAAAAWAAMAWRRAPPARLGVVVQASVRGNLAYVAFPVILSVGGEEALRLAALVSGVLIPFQNLLSVGALAAGRGRSAAELARIVIVNPVVVSVGGGLLWSASGWSGWSWLNASLDILGALAMPAALLALGCVLRPARLRRDLRLAVLASGLKLVVCPGLGLLALRWLGVDPLGLVVATFLLAAPTAIASTAVAQGLDGDVDLAGAAVVGSSLAAFPAFLLWGLLV